ncbi:hypothetical protein QL093DRAFT_2078728 [Fusarium oxysporum]|nr:hypothetical protein QL093DRAFT_2078728 [Fusarium oxysporum]
MAPTSNEKFERTISDIEMWDHTRTLVPKSRNGASPGSKACGRVPGVALCTWYSDCAGEPDILWWAMCLLLPLAGIPGGKNTNTPGTRAQWTWAVAVLQFCSARPGTGRQREVLMRRERQTARSRRLRLKARTNVGARPPDSSGMYHPTPEVRQLG